MMAEGFHLFKEEFEALCARRNEALTFRERQEALRGVERLLTEGEPELLQAVWHDLHKSAAETYITEIDQSLREVRFFRRKLRRWARPERAGFSAMHIGTRGRIIAEPYGVVLVLSPWNYPIQLALMPTIAALGAGNRVVLSMSPRAKATAEAIRGLAARYISPDALRVVPAEAPDARQVYTYSFDYVFYTGGPQFGREVARVAAQNLCPCTLELGGKSPVIVFGEQNLPRVARRVAWGKWLNAGQTCVAPDYLLAERIIALRLAELLKARAVECFGENSLLSPDYPHLVDRQSTERLAAYLKDVQVFSGGRCNLEENYLEPTIVYNPPRDYPLMREELFGPILPIIPIDSLQDAIDHINAGERPLALYFFGKTSDYKTVLRTTRSGGVCRGDTIMHITHPSLPFGGVGASGYGNYHGRAGFETFTHRRALLDASGSPDIPMRYAPYRPLQRVKRLLRLIK